MAPPMRAKQTPMAPPAAARKPDAGKPDPWGGNAAASSAAPAPRPKAAGPTTNNALWYTGAAIMAFGIVDLVLYIAVGWDLTGVAWSPYLASVVGGGLIKASTKS